MYQATEYSWGCFVPVVVILLWGDFSFSSYYVNGRSATRKDFLSPEVLDTFATAIQEVLEVPCRVQSFSYSVSRELAENPE